MTHCRLKHAALLGKCHGTVKDAEHLMSYHVANLLERNGKVEEANYVKIVAQWHKPSDGQV